jgi:hypothetical protein
MGSSEKGKQRSITMSTDDRDVHVGGAPRTAQAWRREAPYFLAEVRGIMAESATPSSA